MRCPRSPWFVPTWIAIVVLAAAAAGAAAWMAKTPPQPPARRFTILSEDGTPPTETSISPDGRFVAYATADRVWLQPLTDARAHEVPGLANSRIAYSCARQVCTHGADGSTDRHVILEGPIYALTSTVDGASIVLSQPGATTLSDIYVMDAPSAATPASRAAPKPMITADRQQRRSDVSPDGRYIVYESNETGRYEVSASWSRVRVQRIDAERQSSSWRTGSGCIADASSTDPPRTGT